MRVNIMHVPCPLLMPLKRTKMILPSTDDMMDIFSRRRAVSFYWKVNKTTFSTLGAVR